MPRDNKNLMGYKKLIVYQKSKELVLAVYDCTKRFPKEEVFVLTSQIRKSAISVMSNVVEGYSKNTSKEYARFLTISIGSLFELEAQLDIARELGYITQNKLVRINILIEAVKQLLYGTRKKISEK